MNNVRKELKIKDFNNIEVFLAVNVTAVQFDPYLEAKAYVDKHNFVYENYKSLTLQITEVMALTSIEEVEAYDITKDYPKKLVINI